MTVRRDLYSLYVFWKSLPIAVHPLRALVGNRIATFLQTFEAPKRNDVRSVRYRWEKMCIISSFGSFIPADCMAGSCSWLSVVIFNATLAVGNELRRAQEERKILLVPINKSSLQIQCVRHVTGLLSQYKNVMACHCRVASLPGWHHKLMSEQR